MLGSSELGRYESKLSIGLLFLYMAITELY